MQLIKVSNLKLKKSLCNNPEQSELWHDVPNEQSEGNGVRSAHVAARSGHEARSPYHSGAGAKAQQKLKMVSKNK